MTDPKPTLEEIIAKIPRRDSPREKVTREELERRAKAAAEEETADARQAYEDAYAEAYERKLAYLLEEYEDDLSE